MNYNEILDELNKFAPKYKTKDIDNFNKKLVKQHMDVSNLRSYVINNPLLYRTYFQVSLCQMKSYDDQFVFIEDNATLLKDWWHVDQLIQFMKRPIPFEYAYKKAKKYIKSSLIYERRWGYVLFLCGLQKDPKNTSLILELMKDDPAYHVQMAEAWLICDLAVYNIEEVKRFLNNSKLKYNILGKAIQKCCDSYRISLSDKEYLKLLRDKLKSN